MGKSIATTKSSIIEHWSSRVSDRDMGAEFCDWATHCWRCGCRRDLQRCHIVPASLGGEDAAENLVLLCFECHEEAPSSLDPREMWAWIRATRAREYDTFWWRRAELMFEERYGPVNSYLDHGRAARVASRSAALRGIAERALDGLSFHFGRGGNLSPGSRVMAMKRAFDAMNAATPGEGSGATARVRSTILAALSQREAAMWVERKRATAPPESPQSPSPARRGLSDVEKADILRLKGAGKSSRTIGLELGRSDRVVRRFLGKVAPPPPPHLRTDRPLLADEEREQILALHAAGRPRNAIAREIGRSPKSVGKVIREQSPRRRGRPPGSRSSTPEQRALAAKLQADGLPLSAIAMRVGMSVAAIGSHLRRRSPAAGKGGGGPFGPGNLGMPPSSARSVIRRERAKADRTP